MPPPPWELFVMPKPSMLEGLHWKLLGYGLVGLRRLVWHEELESPVGKVPEPFGPPISSVVPVGNVSAPKGSDPAGNFTPFDNTVIPAPSNAPIRVGSCNSSAKLPFKVASQPTVASSGNRSTWNCIDAEHEKTPVESYWLLEL